MAFTGSMTSQVTAGQTTAVNDILGQGVQFLVDLAYTSITIVFNFLTQPAVIGVIASLGIIYMVYRKIKARSMV